MILNSIFVENTLLNQNELEQLFELYDSDNIGFILIGTLKEAIRELSLPEICLTLFMDLLKDMSDDEMINLTEFMRIMSPFTSKT